MRLKEKGRAEAKDDDQKEDESALDFDELVGKAEEEFFEVIFSELRRKEAEALKKKPKPVSTSAGGIGWTGVWEGAMGPEFYPTSDLLGNLEPIVFWDGS